MSTGPNSVVTQRAKRQATRTSQWASVARHNLPRPNTVLARSKSSNSRSRRSLNHKARQATSTPTASASASASSVNGYTSLSEPGEVSSDDEATGTPQLSSLVNADRARIAATPTATATKGATLAYAANQASTALPSIILNQGGSGSGASLAVAPTGGYGNSQNSSGNSGSLAQQGTAVGSPSSTATSKANSDSSISTNETIAIASASIAGAVIIALSIWLFWRVRRVRRAAAVTPSSSSARSMPAYGKDYNKPPKSFIGRISSRIPFVGHKWPNTTDSSPAYWNNVEAGNMPVNQQRSMSPQNQNWPSATEEKLAMNNASYYGPTVVTSVPSIHANNLSREIPISDSATPLSATSNNPLLLPSPYTPVYGTEVNWAAAKEMSLSPDGTTPVDGMTGTLTEPYMAELTYNSSLHSSGAEYGGEDTLRAVTLQQLQSPDGSIVPPLFDDGAYGRPQSGPGDYRYSELSSISSGFGDADIIIPSNAGSPVASPYARASTRSSTRRSAHSSAMRSRPLLHTALSSRSSSAPRTPPPVAMRQSWSRPPTSGYRDRDTVMTTVTDDGQPQRFRTVSSWVQQQSSRARRAQRRAEKNGDVPQVPDEPQLTLMMPDGEVPRPVDMTIARK
ncbi:hypothetical protein CFIMG_002645RAa [Ceratocystis fimbriata CBS 114723]|uniref:Uncharacterized protein n=1 Tax=Ceratocystis fimbriata CBS 114723 TaxID=1035309 RepID=A0A2C5X670_9PEZI|nr:hypothetical protein CFIMG_002645RAa [Ceratocystis fimbriata CBS 114723]